MTRRVDLALVGALLAFLALLAVGLFGERLAPHEDVYFAVEHRDAPRPYDPGLLFPLGSDILGRDLFSLVLAGAGTTLAIVFLAGAARVATGLIFATVGAAWAPTRLLADSTAQLVSAIPATIAALILVKVFVKADTSVLVFVGALLLIGWAGPYRVIRSEVDRLARAPFMEGARAMGASDWRLLWRHQIPHLAPAVALNLSQQVVAALVLVAELGVIGIFVGATRWIDVSESLTAVRPGEIHEGLVGETPEWGGLLATSRSVLALWVTRWLIFVPGAAFALTAIAVAGIGFVLARRYARRDLIADLRGRGAALTAVAVAVLLTTSAVLPERYAAARELASAARAEVARASEVETAFADAGLLPIGSSYGITREVTTVTRTGPAKVTVGSHSFSERWPEPLRNNADRDRHVRSLVSATTGGGGTSEAPLVFAGRGITPADYVPRQQPLLFRQPDAAQLIHEFGYADDYAAIDVRGKIVILVRFLGIESVRPVDLSAPRPGPLNGYAFGPLPPFSIDKAIERGAAGVIFIDPALWLYNDLRANEFTTGTAGLVGGQNPYLRAEREKPATTASGVPVVVLGAGPGRALLESFGIDIGPMLTYDKRGAGRYSVSPARDLGVTARVDVPVERRVASVTSYVGEVPGATADASRIVVWAPRTEDTERPASTVIAALARVLGDRRVPLVFVDFDPAIDSRENARHIRRVLGEREIGLVVVLDDLEGSRLRFRTAYGELIPAFDRYAEQTAAQYEVTRETALPSALDGLAPFPLVRTIVVGSGGDAGDARGDAAAVIAYMAGRLALGAPEIPR